MGSYIWKLFTFANLIDILIITMVSVVMCCYNEQQYIREAIESVLRQTYRDFEFIIWNDGSIDKTEEIIKSYKDERIRYFYHDNTGLGEALRLACMEAKGKYIARIDSDDICMPERLEKQVLFLNTHPEYVLCSSAYFYMDAEGYIVGRRFPATWNNIIKRRLNSIAHPTTMFRKDAYDKAGGYRPLKSAQDRILWTRMMPYGKFVNLKEPLLKYRILNSSLSHIIDPNDFYGEMIENLRKKMCSDEEVLLEDVDLHNYIYDIVKRKRTNVVKTSQYVSRTIEERLYDFLKLFLGEKYASNIVYLYKNLYLSLINLISRRSLCS